MHPFTPSVSRCGRRRGFTLIELLTVIAIIGILAAIIIPTVGKVRAQAKRTQGVSNFRSIGQAILTYAADNRDALPGPVNTGVDAQYRLNADTLPFLLHRYLGLPTPTPTTTVAEMFVVPGYEQFQPDPAKLAFQVMSTLRNGNAPFTKKPFGDKAKATTPMTMADVSSRVMPSRAWMLAEVDKQVDMFGVKDAGWYSTLPDAPVRGDNARIVLFFDGHAELQGQGKKFWLDKGDGSPVPSS